MQAEAPQALASQEEEELERGQGSDLAVMPLQEEGSEVVGACAGEGKKVTPAGCCAGLAVTLGICFPC